MDNLYTDPTHFGQRQPPEAAKEITVWGEMLGSGSPDDYDRLVHSFDAQHPSGYELDDMTKILAGYHDFLDKYGFRKAFPTDSSLFQAIGYRTYYFWQRVLEQARADNVNDGLVVSGWESTTIDNHSGIVDNHRFFKGDPRVFAKGTQPEDLFLQPRQMIVAKGGKDLVDVFLLNERQSQRPADAPLHGEEPRRLDRLHHAADGQRHGRRHLRAVDRGSDRGARERGGHARICRPASRRRIPTDGVLLGNDQIEVIDVPGAPIAQKIAVSEPDHEVADTLKNVFHVTPVVYAGATTAGPLDAIVLASKSSDSELDAKAEPGSANGKGPARVSRPLMEDALKRVHDDGTRLVLWADTNSAAEAFCKELARTGVATYGGYVGNLGAPWFGSWFFVRKHWLLDGLPG